MNIIYSVSNKSSIALSSLCIAHCLLVPLLLIFSPSLSIYFAEDSSHYWMLFAVLPISFFSLFIGCKKHKNLGVGILILSGLILLIFSVLFGHDFLGEILEKFSIFIASTLLILGHLKNYRLCQDDMCQDCV
ncbi:MAG: hypothetical protein CL691_04235 [Cellvibrionales bacterium]|nr:hypothetical protein [Cellvibrionales bacterium]|tara:strand:- start:4828 stop:5223 length:396 start_codon:yes stop_codon:yes gene_type:complete